MDMIVRNARLHGQTELMDLAVKDSHFVEIGMQLPHQAELEIDAEGDLVSPPFIDPHLHLDAALTAGQPPLQYQRQPPRRHSGLG